MGLAKVKNNAPYHTQTHKYACNNKIGLDSLEQCNLTGGSDSSLAISEFLMVEASSTYTGIYIAHEAVRLEPNSYQSYKTTIAHGLVSCPRFCI